MHKQEVELFPLTKTEQRMAERVYFANRIEWLIRLKRSRTKRLPLEEARPEQLALFPNDRS